MSEGRNLLEEAREVRRLVAENVEQLRRIGYDPTTLRALIAREVDAGRRALAEMRKAHQVEEGDRAQAATLRIHSADDLWKGSDSVAARASYRDALDRAEKLSGADEASALLRRATRAGDDLLARAVASRSFARGWKDVVDEYGASHPEWHEAARNASDTRTSVGAGLNIVFGVKTPPELDRSDAAQIVRESGAIYRRVDAPARPLFNEDGALGDHPLVGPALGTIG